MKSIISAAVLFLTATAATAASDDARAKFEATMAEYVANSDFLTCIKGDALYRDDDSRLFLDRDAARCVRKS